MSAKGKIRRQRVDASMPFKARDGRGGLGKFITPEEVDRLLAEHQRAIEASMSGTKEKPVSTRGFTLIELLLVLVALSLLAIAAFVVYPMTLDYLHGKMDREFLATASTNIIGVFETAHRFGPTQGNDVSYLSDLQYSGQLSWALPGSLCHPYLPNFPVPVLCTDAFGNPFFWSTMSLVNPDGTLNPFQLQATFQDLSPQQCIQLLQYGVGAFRAQQIEIIRSGQATICVPPLADPAALVRACSGGNLPDGTSGFIDNFQIEWDPWGRPFWMTSEYGWCQEP